MRYKISNASPLTFSGGPYIGILIAANQQGTSIIDTAEFITIPETKLPIIEPKSDYDDNVKSNFLNFDFGLSIQVAIEFSLNENYSGLIFSRFNYGLIDVSTNEFYEDTKYSAPKWKNIGVMLGVGFKL